jgi:hypothetical protein
MPQAQAREANTIEGCPNWNFHILDALRLSQVQNFGKRVARYEMEATPYEVSCLRLKLRKPTWPDSDALTCVRASMEPLAQSLDAENG